MDEAGLIEQRIRESISIKQGLMEDKELFMRIRQAADVIMQSLLCGGKLLLCGNGGSASDAIHIAAEFVGRFQLERRAYPAIALNADIAALTSIANDYAYEEVFSRQVEGLMNDKDVLLAISTSGNSKNVYEAVLQAKKQGGKTIGLLGQNGGRISSIADVPIVVPGNKTARIQECHIMLGHILVEIVEERLKIEVKNKQ